MKFLDEILPLLIGIGLAIILFLGFLTAIKKALNAPAPQRDTIDSEMRIKEQQWKMDDIRQRQKQLMRDQKQKIRDMQRF